jgi:hypothetical protein
MPDLTNCQIPCLPKIAQGTIYYENLPLKLQIKRLFAKPWNYHIKKFLRKIQKKGSGNRIPDQSYPVGRTTPEPGTRLAAGDWVRVRSQEEIQATLDNWNELRGCAFLTYMWQYCGTNQQVLVSMARFLDERDYKVKKCNGIILLKDVMCEGTPVFGQCDRRCHLFWREEWLEKVSSPGV